jgi:signal transduction histidine kinase
VKAIVEAHHGTVSVSSQPGHGSTFTVHLNLSNPSNPSNL